jgi:hypothetical protein
MSNLKMTIAIQDSEMEAEKLQEYIQNFLPQIREFDGVEEVGLVPRDQPVDLPGVTPKDFGAFLLGTVTVISTIKALVEIIDWVEKKWLKGKHLPSSRKMLIEVTTPEGYKLTCAAANTEDLKFFLDQVNEALGKS